MSVLAIVKPLPIAAIGGTLEGVARLLTPSPREAAVSGAGDRTIDIDLGAIVSFDTILLGFSNAAAGSWAASCGAATYLTAPLPAAAIAPSRLANRPRHYLSMSPAPVMARYIRLSAAALPAGYSLGVVVVGLALRPALGQEWGSGRFVVDTGTATRMGGGGFGNAPGVRAGGWQWTLGDLSYDEADALYGLQLDVGTTAPFLVIEDPDPTLGLNERIHWCQLTKLSPNERRNRKQTRWEFVVEDWG